MNDQSKEVYEAERIDGLLSDVASHEQRLNSLEGLIKERVTNDAFEPIKLIVYGLAASIGGVVVALVAKILGIKTGAS